MKLRLSPHQKKKLKRHIESMEPLTLSFRPGAIDSEDGVEFPLNKTQVKKLNRRKEDDKGAQVKISVAQLKKINGALSALGAKLGETVVDKIDNAVRDGDVQKLRSLVESDIYSEEQKQIFRDQIARIESERPGNTDETDAGETDGEGLAPHGYGLVPHGEESVQRGEGLVPHGYGDKKKGKLFPNGIKK